MRFPWNGQPPSPAPYGTLPRTRPQPGRVRCYFWLMAAAFAKAIALPPSGYSMTSVDVESVPLERGQGDPLQHLLVRRFEDD